MDALFEPKARPVIQDTLCTLPAAAPASQGGYWATGATKRRRKDREPRQHTVSSNHFCGVQIATATAFFSQNSPRKRARFAEGRAGGAESGVWLFGNCSCTTPHLLRPFLVA